MNIHPTSFVSTVDVARLRNPRLQAILDAALSTAATMHTADPATELVAAPPAAPPAESLSAAAPPEPPATGVPAPDPSADSAAGPPTADDFARQAKALERERSLRKDAERRAKEHDKAQQRVAELENAGKSEVEQAEARGRRDGAAEAAQKANRRLVRAEARALAGEANFRDPQLVVRLLELDDVTVTDDGDVDAAAITTQLERLAGEQTYLLATAAPPPATPALKPDPTQGPRGAKSTGTDVGREMFQTRRGKTAPA